MLNLSRKIKSDKGSITSFTLLSMLFFLVVVIAIYASVNTKVQKQQKELNTIQKSYEQQEQLNDIYEKKYDDYINSETSTIQVYADTTLKGELKGQKKNTLGTVYTNAVQNKIKIFGGANSTYAYSETSDGKRNVLSGNEITIQATTSGKTIYTWLKGEDGEYTKYYTAVTVKLSTLQDKTIYVAEGKTTDIGEISGQNKGKITYSQIDANYVSIENDKVTGIKAGDTTIIATESNGGAQAKITIKIVKLTLEKTKGITTVGDNKKIQVSGINNGTISAKSNDETIAKVTVSGTELTIIPQKVGNTKIIITESNAGANIEYEIQIVGITLAPNGGTYTMPTTGKATIKTKVNVENASKIELAWTSSKLEWKTIENNSETIKKDCEKGTYYLYVRVDNEYLYQSQAFIVGEEKIAINIKTSTTEWTNQDITATITYPDVTTSNTRKAGYGTTLANAQTSASSAIAPTTNVTVTANGYVYATATDSAGNVITASRQITNIDKTAPTVTLSPNGGSYAKPTSGNATIKTTITATDTGGSGLKTLQYAWSTSNTTEPTTWTTFTNGATVSKTDCTTGTYYIWTRVYDNAGNRATTGKVSAGFVVGAKTITITPNTTAWTNQNVTATITYPDVTTSSTRKAGYGTTLANAQTASNSATAPTTSLTVSANGYVFATATDSAGNVITASKQITNIDKTAPTMTSAEIKNITTTGYDVYVYGVKDSGSGVNRVQFPTWTNANGQDDIQANWSTSDTAKGTKQADGTTWVYHVKTTDHKNEAGAYNTHIYAYDNLGNGKCISTHTITVPSVTITYDNNYLKSNIWNDTNDTNRYSAAATSPSSKTIIEETTAKEGKLIQFTMNAGTSGGPYYANSTKLTSGKVYTWSVYIKASSNKNLRIGQEQNGLKAVTVNTEWQRFTYTFTANDNQYIAFVFYLNGSTWTAGDKLYVHSIEIEEGDGTQNKTNTSKAYNTALGTLSTPTRAGYTFNGWFTAPVGGTQISSTTTTPSANTTYYAHWTVNKYNIDLNMTVDGTAYYSGYNGRITVGLKIDGVDKGYVADYGESSPYGTTWEIYGVKLDGVSVSYNDSGKLGAGALDLRATFYTLTLGVNNTDYGSISPTSLIVPTNNTTYSVSGQKLTVSDGRTATVTLKNVNGYTTTQTGWSSTSGTITGATKVTANLNRTVNQYTLTLNPNGGTYNNKTTSTTVTQNYDTVKNVGSSTPPASCTITYNGNGGTASKSADTSNKSFSGWTKSGTGEYIGTSTPSYGGFTRTAKYDTTNGNYENFTFTASPTTNTWYWIRYPQYKYTSGHTYEIRAKLKINSISGCNIEFRHSAVSNDYGTPGLQIKWYSAVTNGWVDVVLTRTISGTTTTLSSNTVTIAPVFEIYTSDLKNGQASMNFDLKDVVVIDKTTGSLLQGNANLFWYRNGNGTLTANYTAFAKVKLATATKPGYTINGWYDAASGGNKIGNANADYTPTGAKTLYAHWTANSYTVNYNGNGATSGSTASSSHTYDTAKNLTANGFSKTGYTFQGWSTNASATTATYGNSASVKNLTTTANGTVTLYAIWKDTTAPAMTTPTISPSGWTNGNVTLTGKATDSGSGIIAYQWSTNSGLTASSSGWTSITNTKSQISQNYTATANGTYYFYAKDASGNVGKTSIKITSIDKNAPTINSALKSTGTTINSISLSLGVAADTGGSGLKKIEWYYGTTNNPTTKAGETAITTAQTATYTVSNLSLVTTYYFKVIVYDVAGNKVSSSVISAKTANPKAEDVSYTPADSNWKVNNVKEALDYFFNK